MDRLHLFRNRRELFQGGLQIVVEEKHICTRHRRPLTPLRSVRGSDGKRF
jgi:hypothetical protein